MLLVKLRMKYGLLLWHQRHSLVGKLTLPILDVSYLPQPMLRRLDLKVKCHSNCQRCHSKKEKNICKGERVLSTMKNYTRFTTRNNFFYELQFISSWSTFLYPFLINTIEKSKSGYVILDYVDSVCIINQ